MAADLKKWEERARKVGLVIGIGISMLVPMVMGLLVGGGIWLWGEQQPISGTILCAAGLFGLAWWRWRLGVMKRDRENRS